MFIVPKAIDTHSPLYFFSANQLSIKAGFSMLAKTETWFLSLRKLIDIDYGCAIIVGVHLPENNESKPE